MKTERRHELQTNVLADKLNDWIEAAEPYSRAILGGIVAVVVVIFAVVYVSAQQSERTTRAWDRVFEGLGSGDTNLLSDMANKYPRTPVGEWAQLMTADVALRRGTDQIFKNKTEAHEEIRKAADLYQQLLAGSEEIVERATYGLARAHEALGDLNTARGEYKAVAEAGGAFAAQAKQRREDLNRTEIKEFYDWVAKYEPPKPAEKPDKRPDFLNDNLEGASGMQLPASITDRLPTTVTPPSKTSESATPAAESPPAESPEKPAAADKPSTPENSATPQTPAAPESPAAEKPTTVPAPASKGPEKP